MKARIFPRGRIAVLIATFALAVGCAKPINDNQVTSNIQSRLSADSGLQGKQLAVQSEKGVVTLSGTVDNDAQREAAAKYAGSEPGVKTVINNLQVGTQRASAEPEPAPAPTPRSEAPSSRKKEKPSPSRRHGHQSTESNDQMGQAAPPPAMNSAPPPSQDPA